MSERWDCIIIGGGAAGLSAALVLGRARQLALLIDAGEQSNRPAHGIGGLLGHDGEAPDRLYETGREELSAYPSVEVRHERVTDAARRGDALTVTLADGSTESGRAMIIATGMEYRFADLPGLAARWGRSVFHCPFCHGWEVRDRALGVLDADPATGVHRALLLTRWSDEVTLLTNGPASLSSEDRDRLVAARVEIDERVIVEVDGPGEELSTICFSDGTERTCGGLLVAVMQHQRSDLAARLGLELALPSPIAADAIAVGPTGETNLPNVFVAGDVSVGMPSVANAIAAGSNAGAAVVRNFLAAEYGLAAHG